MKIIKTAYKGKEVNVMNNTKVNNYQVAKENARQKAIDWQDYFRESSMSCGEIAYWQEYFEKLGKRYGLLTEFRENCIC
jgi:hypothetical protein